MCVLRVSGPELDVDALLAATTLRQGGLEPCALYRRGELRFPQAGPDGPRSASSGIDVKVSDASWTDLSEQISDAERFLDSHRREIERLAKTPGVSSLVLDFALEARVDEERASARFEHFPASIVGLAGGLGLALELSFYPCSDSADPPAAKSSA